MKTKFTDLVLALGLAVPALQTALAADPLPSWNDTAPKKAISGFVEQMTKPGSPDFVPEPERIAVFDKDRTPWAQQRRYFQLEFALDRERALAPQHPEKVTALQKRANELAGQSAKPIPPRIGSKEILRQFHLPPAFPGEEFELTQER